jgi:hypothetical protein
LRNMIDINLFDTDERLLINSAAAKVKLTDFTRQSFMENLNFTLSITDDDMIWYGIWLKDCRLKLSV